MTTDRKAIQRQRVMNYFIEAAMEIIRNEGIGNVSVRRVASIAGYSYATIYNYFSDLNELLWYVHLSFLREIAEQLRICRGDGDYSIDHFKRFARSYIDYCVENPLVYRFLTIQLDEPPVDLLEEMNNPVLENELVKMLSIYANKGIIDQEDVQVLSEILAGMVTGQMQFHFSNVGRVSHEGLWDMVERSIDFIIGKCRK